MFIPYAEYIAVKTQFIGTSLFNPELVQANNKETLQRCNAGRLWWESIGPLIQGQ